MTKKTTTSANKSSKRGLPVAAKIGLAVTGTAILGLYIGMTVYYNGHFYPKTSVGGIPCGNETSDYVESKNISGADDYLLTVYDRRDTKFHIAGMDIDYEYVATGEEAALLSRQNPFAWPAEIFRSHTLELNRSFVYSAEKLASVVQELSLFDEDYIEAPEDAHLDIGEEGYEVIPEVLGNTPIPEQILSEITNAIDNQETSLTLSGDCYVAPEVYATDSIIADTAAQLDRYMSSTIHYDIDGADENLTGTMILHMLDISEDGTVTVNSDRVAQFVQKLASTYNTYGDVREFVTSKGDTVKIGGGDYGWVINKKAEAEQILSDLSGGTPVTREPVYEQRAVQSGLDDIGNTYVEIDYTNQHLWYYKAGSLVLKTDIVSGNINRGNGSPDGIFKIVYCQRNATLVGEDYESNVKYFMPFAYNVGIHDASWRNSFGGEIYKKSGSHGCINVPEDAAKTLIDAMDLGTPVIAYYREPVKLTAENARISNAFSYVKPEEED